MAKVTLSFEIENVNEEDTWEIEESVKAVLKTGGELLDHCIYDINFIEFETSPEEDEEEE
jgi:hypothetical protein